MVKRALLYFLLFFVSLTIFVVLTVPAAFVWKQVAPNVNLRPVGVQVQSLRGNLWQGQVLARVQGVPVLLSWHVDAGGLMTASLPVDLLIESGMGEVDAHLHAGFGGIELTVPRADVTLAGLNPALRRERLVLDGQLQIQNLFVRWQDGRPVSAEGAMAWSGGDIAYPAGRNTHQRNLPAFSGRLSTNEQGAINLDIRDRDAQFAVIEAQLTEQGVGLLEVKRRLLDLADEPWSVRSKESDVVFKVKKPLFKVGVESHG